MANAYPWIQDGAIIDVLIPHGFGPIVRLLFPILGQATTNTDLYDSVHCRALTTWQAQDSPDGSLKVPVLAETAAQFVADLTLPLLKRPIHLKLRSAKGCQRYMRFFKFSCPVRSCRHLTANGRRLVQRKLLDRPEGTTSQDVSLYFGVSLGAAGFTVLDYRDSAGNVELFREEDGGYLSDTLGGNSEAANAQAAMLDAFLGPEFQHLNARFVSIESACQLMRLALEAQGAASLGLRKHYTWGIGPSWSKGSVRLPARPSRVGHDTNVKQITSVLGIGTDSPPSDPYHRVVTIFGPEGTGNTTVVTILDTKLKSGRASPKVHLIEILRGEDWGTGTESQRHNRVTLDIVLYQLARALGITLRTAQRSVEQLANYLRRVKDRLPGDQVILLNGIDRLSGVDRSALIQIVNELPLTHRIILVTNQWDQAAGFVVRTETLAQSQDFRAQFIKRRPERYFRLLLTNLDRTDRQRAGRHFREILIRVRSFSSGNLTVEQQLWSYLMYIALPAALRKQKKFHPDLWWLALQDRNINLDDLHNELKQDLESIILPVSIVPNPEVLLERISRLCLDRIGERERQAIRRLARVSGSLPATVIDDALQGLFEQVRKFEPVRALFDRIGEDQARLFPRVRRVILAPEYDEEITKLRMQVERRRLMLSFKEMRREHADRTDQRRRP